MGAPGIVESPLPADPFSWQLQHGEDGVDYRRSGGAPDLVLLHGLGMSSAYFVRLAQELHAAGCGVIAPDVPGFGRRVSSGSHTPEAHANALIAWAEGIGITSAVWVGHSLGCNLLSRVAAARPDLVAREVYIGPLVARRHLFGLRALACLARDAARENSEAYRFAWDGLLRAGLLHWILTWRRYLAEVATGLRLRERSLVIAGNRDPFRSGVAGVRVVPGAHACHVTNAAETAAVLLEWLGRQGDAR